MGEIPFPHELLELVFQHVSKRDLISLSRTDRRTRSLLRPYIFRDVTLDWRFILKRFPQLLVQRGQKRSRNGALCGAVTGAGILDDVEQLVEKLCIMDANLQNEWNFQFGKMALRFPFLKELRLHIAGSSNFLKYNDGMHNVEELQLVTNNDGSVFNLNHCKHFHTLKKLQVCGFTLDFDLEDLEGLDIRVSELDLINCSWNYPFQLKSFGPRIEKLHLTYQNHQFILSERFREFLHNPALPNLKYLTISNQNKLNLHITYKIMNFLENIPNLKRLYLLGRISNETLNNFTTHDLENKIRYILNVNDVKIFYSSFVEGMAAEHY